MVFNSLEYAVFLPLVFLVYWTLRRRAQNVFLIAASYLFYGWWDARFLLLIVASTVLDYAVGLGLGRADSERRRRALLLASLGGNLGVLAFFKYFGFFVESAAALLDRVGLEGNAPTLEILLPVGISFYTFQTLSYTIDVYRRRLEPCRDLPAFAAYVTYFPQLVAGPIERASHLLPQFAARRARPRGDVVADGLLLIVQGLFKKVAIADTMAPIVNAAFNDAGSAGWVALVTATLAFGLQIYGDFSGYTDIARGSSRLFGIELMVNFREPYLSRNITEFWRRWHISLSNWLRDYLYVPLGGNRRGPRRTYVNLMLTMLLGGLWHGAAWTFVVWGGLHGAMLAAHRAFRPEGGSDEAPWRPSDLPATLGTFVLVHLAWVFFRASSLGEAFSVLGGVASLRPGPYDAAAVVLVVLGLVAMLTLDAARRVDLGRSVIRVSPSLAGAAFGLMAGAVLVASGGEAVPFIYFQF
jgi:D-alanyl-lipoteichoic acid acyltransferase DltB (MBOAT superfamily)